ncbi:MAG: ROK family protein [Actinomycetota bacterium]
MRGGGSLLLAFDIGGTRVKAGVVSLEDAGVEALRATVLGQGDRRDVLGIVARVGRELLQGRSCAGVAASVPGLIDERGTIMSLPGKLAGMAGRGFVDFLGSEFGCEAIVVNDAVAYGMGEATAGAGKGSERVVVVTIGTGVGVTVVAGGARTGAGPFGGGILGGHIPISERSTGPPDSNGRPDTIEALCAARRLVDLARDRGVECESVEEVLDACREGLPAARFALEEYRERLTRALVALAHAHAPDVIVVGGGPLSEDNPILPGLEERVNERLFEGFRTRIHNGRLGDAAPLYGLAHLYRSRRGAR